MPKKKKVVLYVKQPVTEFRGKLGKFVGCCPECKLTLAAWELVGKTQAKCSRCETVSPVKKLKAYTSINDEYGLC